MHVSFFPWSDIKILLALLELRKRSGHHSFLGLRMRPPFRDAWTEGQDHPQTKFMLEKHMHKLRCGRKKDDITIMILLFDDVADNSEL